MSSFVDTVRSSHRGVSVEEVYKTTSTVKAHGGPVGDPPRVLLTPRSAEACLREGVDPQDLKLRDIDSFWAPKLDPAAQRMRHEAYALRRSEKMSAVRETRKELIDAEEAEEMASVVSGDVSVGDASARSGYSSGSRGRRSKVSKGGESVSLVELEQRRLAKVKARQQREIEQMMAFEMKMAKISEDNARRMEGEKKRAQALERDRLKRRKKAEEERRQKELRKRMMLEAEERRRREVARIAAEREKQKAEEERRAEKQLRREARMREQERARKAKAHKEQTQRILAEQQAEIKRKLEEMQRQEAIRQELQAQQQAERQYQAELKRAEVDRRMKENFAAYERLEAQRKEEFHLRQQASEERRRAREAREAEELKRKKQEAIIEAQKRQMIREDAKREEEKRIRLLLDRQAEAEMVLKAVVADKSRENALRKEKRQLIAQAKKDRVERAKRKEEYSRLQAIKKIEDRNVKIETTMATKKSLLQERRQIAIDTKRQRETIMRAMETAKIKKNWTQANKQIAEALNPASKTKSRKMRTTRSLPALSGANKEKDAWEEHQASAAAAHYAMKAEAVAEETRRRKGGLGADEPKKPAGAQTYKSPYEIPQVEMPQPKAKPAAPIEAVPAFATVDGVL